MINTFMDCGKRVGHAQSEKRVWQSQGSQAIQNGAFDYQPGGVQRVFTPMYCTILWTANESYRPGGSCLPKQELKGMSRTSCVRRGAYPQKGGVEHCYMSSAYHVKL